MAILAIRIKFAAKITFGGKNLYIWRKKLKSMSTCQSIASYVAVMQSVLAAKELPSVMANYHWKL